MRIARIHRINIEVHPSVLLIIGILVYYGAETYFKIVPDANLVELLVFGLLNSLILIFSILIHELAHSFVSQRYGLTVSKIELNLIGGFTTIEQEPATPKNEKMIVIAGPVSNLIFGIILVISWFLDIGLVLLDDFNLIKSTPTGKKLNRLSFGYIGFQMIALLCIVAGNFFVNADWMTPLIQYLLVFIGFFGFFLFGSILAYMNIKILNNREVWKFE